MEAALRSTAGTEPDVPTITIIDDSTGETITIPLTDASGIAPIHCEPSCRASDITR